MREILSDNLKSLMGGFSQPMLKDASQRTGIAPRTLAYIVSKEESNPRLETLINIARGYRISVIALLSHNLGREENANRLEQPVAGSYLPDDPLISKVVRLMETSSATGRAIIHDKARDVAREYPISKGNVA